jgi:hypothetical protein
MATKEALAQVLREVALGDESATNALAQYLEETQVQGPSVVEQQLQELEGRKAFLRTVNGWMRDTPEMLHDNEAYLRAIEIDSQLAQRHPQMDERKRLDMAADLAMDELGDPESRGDKEWIRLERAKRTHTEVEDDQVADDTSVESALDRERGGVIQQMQKDRETLRETSALAYRHKRDPAERR